MREFAHVPERIVLARGSTECEEFAAAELQRYLQQMTGRLLKIRHTGTGGPGEIRLLARRREVEPRLPLRDSDDSFEISVTRDVIELTPYLPDPTRRPR